MNSTLFLILFSSTVHALEIWSMNDQLFYLDRYESTLMSKNCSERKDQCLAFKHYKAPKKYQLSTKALIGGKNPGAIICKDHLNGDVLILKDKELNETAFCRFKDGSMLKASSL